MPSPSKSPIHLTKRQQGPSLMLRGTWVLVASAVAWLSFQDVGVANQLALAVTAVAGLILMQVCRLSKLMRLLFIVIAGFMTLRYLAWRVTDTLPAIDSASFIPGILLFLAELYGIAMYFFGVFVNINPIERKPAPLPEDPSIWPTVDVFVPSYNEDAHLLEVTLTAAKQIRYPVDKLQVHLLDDGGTEQKRADTDPEKAAHAQERHEDLQDLCARLGVNYHTRARNEHAKAGNINAALPQTDGDLILILDADHVPTQDFLENTVGYFLQDPKLFLVQTPHFFVNPDPVERNLRTWERMPSENEMFYCVGQKGLDFWNAAFFCGSAAVLRRRHLEEIGGIAGVSITEDAETALELHARGYNSAYVSKPMVAGLCPETFAGFIGQRTRWAQGMLQILLLKNPLFKRGLSLPQRIAYLSSSVFWLFPLARALFLLMPLTYLFFGMKIYNASLDEFIAYGMAHLICSLMLTNYLFGKVRWPFVSELYEMAQSLFVAPAVLSVFLRPRAPTFKVTAKAETLARRFVSDLATPIVAAFGILVAGTAAGIWRYFEYPLQHENLLIVLGWNTVNLIFIGAALGIVYERRQRRQIPRMPRELSAELQIGERNVHASIEDLSVSGAQIVLAPDETIHGQFGSSEAVLRFAGAGGQGQDLSVQIRHAVVDDDRIVLGIKFTPASQAERDRVVQLCYGSSDAWEVFQKSRQRSRTILGGLAFVVSLGFRYGLPALFAILREKSRIANPRRTSARAKPLALQIGGER
ncbi:MAG: UDP-forming cellulose synthase catalytic subunit [Pseudomonadota bacterium]